ncbi:MAG: alpha/beta hydrolase [Methylobacteriaceae bacterium]|nr:alpha/beta hydrolase [Methylobacteriaceae bacterium]
MTRPVDPQMRRILAALLAAPAVDLQALPMAQARATFETQQAPWRWRARPIETRDLDVPGAAGPMRARLYLPRPGAPAPLVLYAHGGGWTFGSIDTHDTIIAGLAIDSGAAVLGVDYRLAPEHPFPAPVDDLLAALGFVEAGGLGREVDPARIALAGDSAGANIALGALIARREAGGALPRTAALYYGCYAPIFDTQSHRDCGEGYLLRSEMMRWYWRNFLGPHQESAPPPAAAPLVADLTGLPPLYLNAAGLDPLLDDTMMIAARLASAGVRHRLDVYPGVVHGFLRLARDLPAARTAIADSAAWIAARFAAQE